MRKPLLVTLLVAANVSLTPPMQAQQTPILQAMQEEMKRAMDSLRLPNEPAPYYIEYTIEDVASANIATRLGSVVYDSSNRGRTLRVDVRVGDYAFDSSRFPSYERDPGMLSMYGQYGVMAPLDDDVYVMRRQIWLATDTAYKRAVQTLARKRAAVQNRAADAQAAPDFSRETPAERIGEIVSPALEARSFVDDLRTVSAVFSAYPDIYSSTVTLSESQGTRYYLNSEGFKAIRPIRSASIRVIAQTQAADGMPLNDSFTTVGTSVKALPGAAALTVRTREMAEALNARRTAPVGDDFVGPVLVQGQAASSLLAQTLVPLFLSVRPPEGEGAAAGAYRQMTSPFLSRLGSRVMPDAFIVSDTPSLARFGQTTVPGAYSVDDEGVPAKDVVLVQQGKLMTLLSGRTPQKGVLQSNGHSRGGRAQAGVFQVESAQAVPAAELKAKYLELLKAQNRPFGYIVRTVLNPTDLISASMDPSDLTPMMMMTMGGGGVTGGRPGPIILSAAKVLPDGTEQAVRGLNFMNVQYSSYRNILEASRERNVFDIGAGEGGAIAMMMAGRGGGEPPTVSLIVPDLIFEELEIQQSRDIPMKAPIVASPLKK